MGYFSVMESSLEMDERRIDAFLETVRNFISDVDGNEYLSESSKNELVKKYNLCSMYEGEMKNPSTRDARIEDLRNHLSNIDVDETVSSGRLSFEEDDAKWYGAYQLACFVAPFANGGRLRLNGEDGDVNVYDINCSATACKVTMFLLKPVKETFVNIPL